jgi:hypothetical protein
MQTQPQKSCSAVKNIDLSFKIEINSLCVERLLFRVGQTSVINFLVLMTKASSGGGGREYIGRNKSSVALNCG